MKPTILLFEEMLRSFEIQKFFNKENWSYAPNLLAGNYYLLGNEFQLGGKQPLI